jgi:hypothetical protein
MLEAKVEDYLVEQCELHGALCEKHVSPGRRGPPDRLVTLPWAAMDLVETKRPGGRARVDQVKDHERRAKRGVPVYLLDTFGKVDVYVNSRVKNGRHVPRLFSVQPENAAEPPRDCLCSNMDCARCYPQLNNPGHESCDCADCRPFTT